MLRDIDQSFPFPILDAINARHLLNGKNPRVGLSFSGAFEMQHPKIKVSARSLVYLLAESPAPNSLVNEESTVGEFHPEAIRFFKRQLEQGRTVQSILLEPEPDLDDDWIVITFGPPDPAISPYLVPKELVPPH